MIVSAPATSVGQRLREEPVVGNYFVAAYPPFSCWQSGPNQALEDALRTAPGNVPIGLYIHIPFCQKKCDYCYYLSYVGQSARVVDRYLETVVRELELYAAYPGVHGRPISFVYFGGGTPSTLTSAQVRLLGFGLQSALPWSRVEEITFECAPRAVRRKFLETLAELKVTRISMGVQSFDNQLLELNGRIHMAEDVLRAYELIQEIGFAQVNLDLMVGLIGETEESWRSSVRQVIRLSPDSVTLYQTEIPHNTRLYQNWKAGALPGAEVTWEQKRARLGWGFDELERAGYTRISAYTAVKRPGKDQFRYQDYLWRGGDMLGLGVASFGYFAGTHFQNEVTLESYEMAVSAGWLPVMRALELKDRDRLVRELILQLKWGEVSRDYFRDKFSEDPAVLFRAELDELKREGLVAVDAGAIRLTTPGLLCVDRWLPVFYDSQYRDVQYT